MDIKKCFRYKWEGSQCHHVVIYWDAKPWGQMSQVPCHRPHDWRGRDLVSPDCCHGDWKGTPCPGSTAFPRGQARVYFSDSPDDRAVVRAPLPVLGICQVGGWLGGGARLCWK